MRWLVWKEYRSNRLILIVGAGLLLVPHVIALVNGLRNPHEWDDYFKGSTLFSLFVTQIMLALLGGNAIAGERADRSAEFLACLPVSRLRNLASKLVLAPLAVAAILGVNLLVLLFVSGCAPDLHQFLLRLKYARPDEVGQVLLMFGCIAATSLTFFCVSWLFSSLLNSAVFSVAAGLIAPLAIIMGIQGVLWWFQIEFHGERVVFLVLCWYCGLCLALSVLSFISGTVYYLRRIEP